MRFLSRLSLRMCALILVLSLLWLLCGAPVLPVQWQAIPLTLRRTFTQLPLRMKNVFTHWYTSSDPFPAAGAETLAGGITLTIWDAQTQSSFRMALEQYVRASTAGEMPAAYHPEALKAQAVAIRTRAIASARNLGGNGCATHPTCDLCTDASCCQAFASEEELLTRWGSEYRMYSDRITQAVQATAGEIITWEGLPIQVLYHACSGGVTEDAQAVFSRALPYLVSVQSPGEEFSTAFTASISYSHEDACARLLQAFPGCGVTPEGLAGQLRLQSSTASGRIGTILVGNEIVTGRAFRSALDLRSTLVTWETGTDQITFHTRGYGHGVGMSQAGANAMASQGKSYRDIISHYYPGTAIVPFLSANETNAS